MPGRDYQIEPGLEDFRNFLWLTWDFLGLPAPTPVQYDVAGWLQSGPDRSITEGFRGMGKSWITSTLVCHDLYLDPTRNIMVVSASGTRAAEFSQFTLKLIHEMPVLRPLIPRDGQRTSMIGFDVGPAGASHAPSVKSIGITGQITGSRADRIIPDDVESSTNSLTVVMRDKLRHAVKEFENVLKPGGRVNYLGTPHLDESLYGYLESLGYEARMWPVKYPTKKLFDFYGSRLAPVIAEAVQADPGLAGTSVEPTRFDDEDLIVREARQGRSSFALQFLLNTALGSDERYPLKMRDVPVMDLNPDKGPVRVWHGRDDKRALQDVPILGLKGDRWYPPMSVSEEMAPWEGSVMAIDPSGSGEDESTWCVVNLHMGGLYLMEMRGSMDGYGDGVLQAMALTAKRWGVQEVVIEANFGDGMFTRLLTPWMNKIHPCTLTDVKHSTQKEKRIIHTLEPVLNQHQLVFNRSVVERDLSEVDERVGEIKAPQYTLGHQMTHLMDLKGCLSHDDRVDVLAIAVAYWTEKMGQDRDEAAKQHALDEFQAEIDEFLAATDQPGRGSASLWTQPLRHLR